MFPLYIFVYLFLAHLLADFVFQPKMLMVLKHKSWKGVFIHSLVHFLVMTAVLWPLMSAGDFSGIFVLLLVGVAHFLLDTQKIKMEKNNHHYIRLFLLDQAFHILTLLIATLILGNILISHSVFGVLIEYLVNFLPFALYGVLAVLCTYTYEIVQFQFVREKNGGNTMKFNYHRMLMRMLVLSLVFGVALFFHSLEIAHTFGF